MTEWFCSSLAMAAANLHEKAKADTVGCWTVARTGFILRVRCSLTVVLDQGRAGRYRVSQHLPVQLPGRHPGGRSLGCSPIRPLPGVRLGERAEPQENVRPPGQRRPPAGRPDSHPGAGRSRTPGAGSRCSPPPSARCTLFGHTTLDGIDRDHADALLAEALADTGGWLNAVDRLLDRLRRPNDRDRLVDTPAGAAAAAAALGLPDDDHWAHGMAHTAVTDRPQGEAATPPRADH